MASQILVLWWRVYHSMQLTHWAMFRNKSTYRPIELHAMCVYYIPKFTAHNCFLVNLLVIFSAFNTNSEGHYNDLFLLAQNIKLYFNKKIQLSDCSEFLVRGGGGTFREKCP